LLVILVFFLDPFEFRVDRGDPGRASIPGDGRLFGRSCCFSKRRLGFLWIFSLRSTRLVPRLEVPIAVEFSACQSLPITRSDRIACLVLNWLLDECFDPVWIPLVVISLEPGALRGGELCDGSLSVGPRTHSSLCGGDRWGFLGDGCSPFLYMRVASERDLSARGRSSFATFFTFFAFLPCGPAWRKLGQSFLPTTSIFASSFLARAPPAETRQRFS